MEKLIHHQNAIIALLQEHAYSGAKASSIVIADKERNQYQLALIGQDENHTSYIWIRMHLQLKPDGKIWIIENKTEYDIGDELVERGIAKSDIVVALLPEHVRKYTEYAVN